MNKNYISIDENTLNELLKMAGVVQSQPPANESAEKAIPQSVLDKWLREGQEFKARRLALGLSQKDIAGKTGVSDSTVSKLERGLPITRSAIIKKSYDNLLRLVTYENYFSSADKMSVLLNRKIRY